MPEEDLVTPYEVKASSATGVNYDKLIDKFGVSKLSESLLKRIEKLTGRPPHFLLRREIFFSHRDLENILDAYENSLLPNSPLKSPGFYLYTGRGPSSSSMHIGHTIPLLLTKYFQDAFSAPLVIMISDDEKYACKTHLELEEIQRYAKENIKDLIALGFDIEKTYIFMNSQAISSNPDFFQTQMKIMRHITFNQVKAIFGFSDSTNLGLISYTATQCVPSFGCFLPKSLTHPSQKTNGESKRENCINSMICLIPCAIDQDNFFRMSRDVAVKIKQPKPSLILSKFIPSLAGSKEKMSSSSSGSTSIFLSDTPSQIKNKINKYAFSGGKDTIEEHRKFGGDPTVDVSFIYLKHFLESDEELNEIETKYKSGEMLSGELKKKTIEVIQDFVSNFQKQRSEIRDDVVERFLDKDHMKF